MVKTLKIQEGKNIKNSRNSFKSVIVGNSIVLVSMLLLLKKPKKPDSCATAFSAVVGMGMANNVMGAPGLEM